MKKIINPKILATVVIIVFYALLLSQPSYAIDNPQKNSPQQTVKQQITTLIKDQPTINELLITILHNAQFVVKQIKDSKYNSVTRKEALAAIKKAQKRLLKQSPSVFSKNAYDEISTHIAAIEKEATAFARHQSHIKKYDSTNAEKQLQNLARIINNIAENLSESYIAQNYQKLEHAIIETENIIKNAQIIINTTNTQRDENKISRIKAARIIGEQKNIIINAKATLETTKQNALNNVFENDAQTNYLTQLTNAASSLGKQIIAPFKSGYGYTEQEKNIARAVIAELEKDQNNYIHTIHQAMQNEQLSAANKDALLAEYAKTIDAFNNAIHEQQLITGDAMSFNRKLFWAAVGFAGAIGGAYLGYQYFNQIPEIGEAPKINVPPIEATGSLPNQLGSLIINATNATPPSNNENTQTTPNYTPETNAINETQTTPEQNIPKPKQSQKNIDAEERKAIDEHRYWKAQQQASKEQDNEMIQKHLRQQQRRRESKIYSW